MLKMNFYKHRVRKHMNNQENCTIEENKSYILPTKAIVIEIQQNKFSN